MAAINEELKLSVVVSTETIKPSSPTPAHLQTHTLSWIDQITPRMHICLVLFYLAGDGGDGHDEYTSAGNRRRLTRVEVVTALIWRCLIRASSSADEFVAAHVVNLRARMRPPLPETAFGNIMTLVITPGLVVPREHRRHAAAAVEVMTTCMKSSSSSTTLLRRLTEEKTSEAIRNVDAGYIRETLQGAAAPLGCACRVGKCLWRGVRLAWFSSLWGFPFYETDFGWGRPAWVAGAGNEAIQAEGVTLMGRREGGGHMEAWVSLEAEEMDRLDGDPELLSLLSSHPLPSLPGFPQASKP